MNLRKISKAEWFYAVSACTLCFVVGIGLMLCKPEGIFHSIGEAVVVAGVLTITVDPMLKRRLQKETASDIFSHLLGAHLPLDLREKLQDVVLRTSIYRRNLNIQAVVTKRGASHAEVEITIHADVVAVKDDAEYEQYLAFEESERPEIVSATVISEKGRVFPVEVIALRPREGEPMVKEFKRQASLCHWRPYTDSLEAEDH